MVRTATGQLEDALGCVALEDARLDLDKLIGQEQGQQRDAVRVDGDVEGDHLAEEDGRVPNCVCPSATRIQILVGPGQKGGAGKKGPRTGAWPYPGRQWRAQCAGAS